MNDNALNALIKSVIGTGLTAMSIGGVTVAQNYQPTTQGAVSGASCYFFPVGPKKRYGWLERDDVWVPNVNPSLSKMVHSETQWYESMYQITCLKIQDPADVSSMTASDLANAVASILQSDATRATLVAQNVGVLRITDIRNPPFFDDKGRNEYAANFDFTLTHEGTIVSETPIVEEFELDVYRV